MISFEGFNDVIKSTYDNSQGHVFEYWEELSDGERRELLEDLKNVDFDLMKKLYTGDDSVSDSDFSPAPFIKAPVTDEEKKIHEEARQAGIEHIKKGKVAAFIVAGGQGSRLGFDGPKGKFPVSPIKEKSLFQIHGEKILKYSKKYGVAIPWLIMTSSANHNETVQYFEENSYFGLDKNDVMIFPQNMIPSLGPDGNLVMQGKSSLFKNPDGHGGSLTALYTSGALAELKKRGIEIISYFQVDNPIVKIVDPVFIGFHVKNGAHVSSKALKKAYPGEKVGVFVKFSNNRIGVVEYSDLPDEKAELKNDDGELQFSAGSIAIHLFEREFAERVTSGEEISLPFHTAKKKLKVLQGGSQVEIDGFKYEKFVFDALPLTENNLVYETIREEEFAPVKNATGIDSVESSRELMIDLHRSWLRERGVSVPDNVKVIEISPLLAVEPEDLDPVMTVPGDEKVYLG